MRNKTPYIIVIILIIIFRGILIRQQEIANTPIKNDTKNLVIIDKIETKLSESINKTVTSTVKTPIIQQPACPIPQKRYEDMWLLDIGQNISLPEITYIPEDLVKIPNIFGAKSDICLTKDTKDNLEIMLNQAKADGYNIKVTSGFRTYNYQTGLLNTAIAGGNLNANLSIAKAGYSEHQLGTAVDLSGESIGYTSAVKVFDKTPEALWLKKYASDYGFIESYPEGKENITGYLYEPWHYRYVGFDNAKEILQNGQTITEFLPQ
ncbi:MAG: M15 family metallopeptidase [Candidatus Paceibacterota bacterium]